MLQPAGSVYLPWGQLLTPLSADSSNTDSQVALMCTADDTMCVQRGSTIVVLCGREKLVYLYSQRERGHRLLV